MKWLQYSCSKAVLLGLGLLLSLTLKANAEDVVENGDFENLDMGSFAGWSGASIDVGGPSGQRALLQDGGGIQQELQDSLVFFPWKVNDLEFEHEIDSGILTVTLGAVFMGIVEAGDQSPAMFSLSNIPDVNSPVVLGFSFQGGGMAKIDNVVLDVDSGPTPTETDSGSDPTPVSTPSMSPTPTPTATVSPTPTVIVTPTTTGSPLLTPTPTPGDATRLQVSANPEFLRVERLDLSGSLTGGLPVSSTIRMAVVDEDGMLLPNAEESQFSVDLIRGSGEVSGVGPRFTMNGQVVESVFESIYFPDAEGWALIEVTYQPAGLDEKLRKNVRVVVDVIPSLSGSNISPPSKNILYQRTD